MCVAWSGLEYVLFQLFHSLTGLPTPVARSVFWSQTTNLGRVNLLRATFGPLLTNLFNPTKENKQLKGLLDGLAPLATERNSYVHDPWALSPPKKRITVQFHLKSQGSHGRLSIVTAPKIAALTRKINTASHRIALFNQKHRQTFPTSRERLLLDPALSLLLRGLPRPQNARQKGVRARLEHSRGHLDCRRASFVPR
jgi:hypothetical protein